MRIYYLSFAAYLVLCICFAVQLEAQGTFNPIVEVNAQGGGNGPQDGGNAGPIGGNTDPTVWAGGTNPQVLTFDEWRDRDLIFRGGDIEIIVSPSPNTWILLLAVALLSISFYLVARSSALLPVLFLSRPQRHKSIAGGDAAAEESADDSIDRDAVGSGHMGMAVSILVCLMLTFTYFAITFFHYGAIHPWPMRLLMTTLARPEELAIYLLIGSIVPSVIAIERFMAMSFLSRTFASGGAPTRGLGSIGFAGWCVATINLAASITTITLAVTTRI